MFLFCVKQGCLEKPVLEFFFFLIFNFYSGLRADLAKKRKKEKDMSAILCVTWKQKLIEGWEMLTKPNFIV